MSLAGFAVVVGLASMYKREAALRAEQYEQVKSKARHEQIDDINGKGIYMVIYGGDTLGVVCAPDKWRAKLLSGHTNAAA